MSFAFWEVYEWVVVPGTGYPPIPTTMIKLIGDRFFALIRYGKEGNVLDHSLL